MLMGLAEILPKQNSATGSLLADHQSEQDEDDGPDTSSQILYMASFGELAAKHVQYDTIIWLSISLVLVLAWGIGIIMLLYLPIRRYILQKDISSRKLYVTSKEIVYKVSRPSFIPFWGVVTIEKRVPLSLVIDIIIEQGCLQSVYGIHTFRVESIAHGKAAAPVDELQVQGVSMPGVLRKVIITEASKVMQYVGASWRPTAQISEGENVSRMGSSTEDPAALISPSKSGKMIGLVEQQGVLYGDVLHKLEEISKSLKKIEVLIEKSRASESG